MLQTFLMWLQLPRDEKGQGMVEYAIMIAVLALLVILGLGLLGTALNDAFSNLASWVKTNVTTP